MTSPSIKQALKNILGAMQDILLLIFWQTLAFRVKKIAKKTISCTSTSIYNLQVLKKILAKYYSPFMNIRQTVALQSPLNDNFSPHFLTSFLALSKLTFSAIKPTVVHSILECAGEICITRTAL